MSGRRLFLLLIVSVCGPCVANKGVPKLVAHGRPPVAGVLDEKHAGAGIALNRVGRAAAAAPH